MKQEKIGTKIKELRKEKNLTQTDLAEALGYSDKSVISHIEKGDADMTYEKILLLFRKYAIDANDFFKVKEFDQKLENWRMTQRAKKKVAVYIHGFNGSSEEVQDYAYLAKDYDVVGLDYKDGNPWELGVFLKKEFEKLTKNYKEVILIANSIGAFYAYEYLSDFDIKQAFFISPIADMLQIIINLMMKHGITRSELKEKKEIKLDEKTLLSYDFYQHVSNYKDNWAIPTDILYGNRDDIVYIENIADFLAAHPNVKLTIKQGAEHYFHTDEEKEFIKNWILSSLKEENSNESYNAKRI